MIYLLDEKDKRQCDYGWTKEQFEKYKDTIIPIYKYSQLSDGRNIELFQPGNIILFHESFFDNEKNKKHKKDGTILREKLNEYAREHAMEVAYFSGGKNGCKIEDNIAYLPVENLYRHLEIFIKKIVTDKFDWGYLLYGEDPLIEENLITCQIAKLDENYDEDLIQNNGNVLILQSSEYALDLVFDNCVRYDLFPDRIDINALDKCLDNIVFEKLNNEKYDKIIIPLCFGPTLCDYNGLRLATHIRCTDIVNRTTPIYIYGVMNFSYLINNPCFDILKTEKVKLIDFDYNIIINTINQQEEDLDKERLSIEMRKMHMDIPQNYNDNHSIANEWALYRWVKAIGEEHFTEENASEVLRVLKNVKTNLYFKYLDTIYPSKFVKKLAKEQFKFKGIETIIDNKYNVKISAPKILYIDDEYLKWSPLFKFFMEENGFSLDCMTDCYGGLQEELIDKCILYIKENNINIVILDFRLLPIDFGTNNSDEITGIKLLKKIKEENIGIQVIIFSATNKVWNLQKLQKLGANGFIIKESPQNSSESSFTKKTINLFRQNIAKSIRNRFTFDYYNICDKIELSLNDKLKDARGDYKEFIGDLKDQIIILKRSVKLLDQDEQFSMWIVFLNWYNILEQFKTKYLKYNEKGFFELGISNNRIEYSNLKNKDVSIYSVLCSLCVKYFKIDEWDQYRDMLEIIKDKRNDYIHPQYDKNGTIIRGGILPCDIIGILTIIGLLVENMCE